MVDYKSGGPKKDVVIGWICHVLDHSGEFLGAIE
jgi:hypothetical protein